MLFDSCMDKKKVFVGLSGGVDSAVSAALLRESGAQVTGVFIKIWQPEFIECTWREDRLDAMRVAAHLDIPFKEIDLSEQYQTDIVQSMLDAYATGTTPNPDVLCNEKIKFGHFLKWALAAGADYVGTGHYARIVTDARGTHLLRGVDAAKDQSYFLHRLGAHELSHSIFPVGSLSKREVRKYAQRFGIPVAGKPDSQGLCFVGDISMPEFLGRYIPLAAGNVLDSTGAVIGNHDGAALYTVGQRHGFSVDRPSVPMYVLNTDTAGNTITVSASKDDAAVQEIFVTDHHWIRKPYSGEILVQTRYREKPVRARIDGQSIHFLTPHIVSPGQAAVFYADDECLGGAVIASRQ